MGRRKAVIIAGLCCGIAAIVVGVRAYQLAPWIMARRAINSVAPSEEAKARLGAPPVPWESKPVAGERVQLGFGSVIVSDRSQVKATIQSSSLMLKWPAHAVLFINAGPADGSPATSSAEARSWRRLADPIPVAWKDLRSVPVDELEALPNLALMRSRPACHSGMSKVEKDGFDATVSLGGISGETYVMEAHVFSNRSALAFGVSIRADTRERAMEAMHAVIDSLELNDESLGGATGTASFIDASLRQWLPPESIEIR